jgi:hypothetical protein
MIWKVRIISHQQGFDKIKKVIGTELFLCYTDLNEPFHLYTDASDHQWGEVIIELNTAKKRCPTIERELLSAIETCKKYKNILLGYHQPIIVILDHKNNTFNVSKGSDRDLCWLLLLEEYGVTCEYLPGKKIGTVSDTLSRLDIDSLEIQEEEVLKLLSASENNSISNIKLPMHTALIFKEHAKVKEPGLREKGLAHPQYSIQSIEGYNLLFYKGKKQDLHSSIIDTKSTV